VNLHELTAARVRDVVASGEASCAEVTRACLDRIKAHDGALNAFLEVFDDRAMAQAADIDARIRRDGAPAVGALAGVPIALKDNMCLSWGRTTCGSRMLESYESPYTGTAMQRLLDAGCVVLGKTNLDEFAMGSSTEHSAFGPTRNPWDPARSPGGSSGGSAVAVAARMAPLSLGSDTGGSIRQPAALCGIVGLRPTYGRVSRWGLVAFASSLDQIGPFARTVEDAALALSAISGVDPFDSTSADVATGDFADGLDDAPGGLRIGVYRPTDVAGQHPAVTEAVERAAQVYERAGAEIVEVDLPNIGYAIATYYLVAPAEASSNLARYDGIRYGRRATIGAGDDLEALYARSRAEGFGPEVQRRIMLGTHALSSGYYDAYYNTALKARRVIKNDFDGAFAREGAGVHAVLMPTTPEPAFRIGAKTDDPLALYLQDVYTAPANLAGLPAISLPGGFAEEDGRRLPVGVQLYGKAFDERTLLRIARIFERETDFAASPPD
jgi:aspartyl-tRNA(Asn)/glutamyl-tRNA(Gln) amidotransferase subunit A